MTRHTLGLHRLENRLAPAVATWDGGPDGGGSSPDNHWTNPDNWVGDIAPQPGDDILFPTVARQATSFNDFAAGTTFRSLAVNEAGYTIGGNAIAVTDGVTSDINIAEDSASEVALAIGGTGGLTKTGNGTLTLSAANTYVGLTAVQGGELEVRNGSALGATGAGNETAVASATGLVFAADGLTVPEAISFGNLNPDDLTAGLRTLPNVDVTFSGSLTLTGSGRISTELGSLVTITAGIGESAGPQLLTLGGALSSGVFFAPGSVTTVSGTVTVLSNVAFNGSGPIGLVRSGTVNSVISGTGNTGPMNVNLGVLAPGSTFQTPGVGTLTTQAFFFGSSPFFPPTFVVHLGPTGNGRVVANGFVQLSGGQLSVDSLSNFTPTPGGRYRVIDNDGADAVSGAFDHLPEGAVAATFGNLSLRITYQGGTGNDVELVAGPAGVLRRFAVGAGAGGVPQVNVYDANDTLVRSFLAYDASFRGGVNVAVGDFNADGVPDVATAPSFGGGPVVRLWDGATGAMQREFLAYDANFRGGVNLAAGFVGAHGEVIITGAGQGGGPHVRTFDAINGLPQLEFFAYDANFRGGVTVAAGEPPRFVGHDFLPGTIVTGAGVGGGPHVKVFHSFTGQAIGPGFFAFDAAFTGGVNVAFEQSMNPGNGTIVVAPKAGGGPVVRGFGADGVQRFQFLAYDANFRGGVTVAAQPLGAADELSLITGPGPGGGPVVRVWGDNGTTLARQFNAFDPAFQGGVFVG